MGWGALWLRALLAPYVCTFPLFFFSLNGLRCTFYWTYCVFLFNTRDEPIITIYGRCLANDEPPTTSERKNEISVDCILFYFKYLRFICQLLSQVLFSFPKSVGPARKETHGSVHKRVALFWINVVGSRDHNLDARSLQCKAAKPILTCAFSAFLLSGNPGQLFKILFVLGWGLVSEAYFLLSCGGIVFQEELWNLINCCINFFVSHLAQSDEKENKTKQPSRKAKKMTKHPSKKCLAARNVR